MGMDVAQVVLAMFEISNALKPGDDQNRRVFELLHLIIHYGFVLFEETECYKGMHIHCIVAYTRRASILNEFTNY